MGQVRVGQGRRALGARGWRGARTTHHVLAMSEATEKWRESATQMKASA